MIGKLDQRVTFQRRTLTDDGAGGATESWANIATVWARVTPMNGREREEAMRNEATSNYVIRVRNRSDLKEKDRVLWGSRYLNVRFLRDAGVRKVYLDIEAEMGAKS